MSGPQTNAQHPEHAVMKFLSARLQRARLFVTLHCSVIASRNRKSNNCMSSMDAWAWKEFTRTRAVNPDFSPFIMASYSSLLPAAASALPLLLFDVLYIISTAEVVFYSWRELQRNKKVFTMSTATSSLKLLLSQALNIGNSFLTACDCSHKLV